MRQTDDWKAPFFAIWAGQAFSLLGSRIVGFALIWWLTDTTGSATVLAMATLMTLIPEIGLAPIAGAYVDRWDRRKVMLVADSPIALASLGLATLFWMDVVQVWHIYAIMLLRGIGGSFHWPAMQASTSLMVPKDQLTRVAGFNMTLNGVLNIAGPPLGALLMELLPLHSVMLADVGTALIAVVPLFFVHIPQPKRERGPAQEGAAKASIWSDIGEGLRYLRGWPGMMALIGMVMVFKIASMPAFSLIPLLVRSHFGGDAAQLSFMQALFGVGVVIGGLVLSVWGGFQRKIYTVMSGVILFSFTFAGFGLAPSHLFNIALASAFVMGLVIPMIDGPIMAIMQSTVAPELQGRVFTLMGSLLNLVAPLSLAVAGPTSDRLGIQMWYLLTAVISIVMGIAGFFIPAIVHIEENGHTAPETQADFVPAD